MKIIQIMDSLTSTGGVNTFVFDLCVAQKKLGQDVSLIGIIGDINREPELAKTVKNAGIPVYCLWFSSKKEAVTFGASKMRTLIKEISGNAPTICNLHLKLSVLIGCMATIGMKNVKCVETYHSQYSRYWMEQKLFSSRISKYICCSNSAEKEFLQRFYPKAEKVVCIPNGINLNEFNSSETNINKSDNRRVSFLSVGRFTDQKNFHVTTAAFSSISPSVAIYRIIGEGPLKQRAIDEAKGSNGVQFLGNVDREEVKECLRLADMVIMPSLWEGLSIFMLEAMATGCPLMLSDIESFRTVVGEPKLKANETWRLCKWGYLVKADDVNAYTCAALHFIDNEGMKKHMSKEVVSISMKYSIDETAGKYIELYHNIIK